MRRLLAALALLVAACSTSTPEPPDRPERVPEIPLGIAFPPVADAQQRAFTAEQLAALGIRHVRIAQPWALREPERDVYVWEPLDARIAALRAAGVSIFLTLELKDRPAWVAALSAEEQEAEHREYVRDLLGRVGGDLEWVQYGNEWNAEVPRFGGGGVEAFVRDANAVYDEVQRLPSPRPRVALGSVAIGGLRGLALLQGRIENVFFGGSPLYSAAEVEQARRDGPQTLGAFQSVAREVRYDAVDLHLYDDVWNWPVYAQAVDQWLADAGRQPGAVGRVVSEFGGPHPTLEPGGEAYNAERVADYVRALAALGVERSYFFKLVEERGAEIAHPNSFLIDADLRRTASFGVLAQAAQR